MYGLLSAVCLCTQDFVSSHGKLLYPTVLGSLGEGDPVVTRPLWEAVMLILSHDVVGGWREEGRREGGREGERKGGKLLIH